MLLLNTNHNRKSIISFISLCVLTGMVISLFCFPCYVISRFEEKELCPSEAGEIDEYASDCVITIAKTSEDEGIDNISSDENNTDEKENGNENSTEDIADEISLEEPEEFEYQLESEAVVTKIEFEKTDTINTREDDKSIIGHVKVDVIDLDSFDLSGISFLSEDPKVAKIDFDYCRGLKDMYYKLTPVSGGETQIYAQTEDGTICSERIKVIVKKNEVETIDLEKNCTLELGESKKLEYVLAPENPRNKYITWSSSDSSIVTVTPSGVIEGVACGKATITASSSNGVNATCNVIVRLSKREMVLNWNTDIVAYNSVGNEWSHFIKINETVYSEWGEEKVTLNVGDKLTFYCESEESDNKPDVGSKTAKHTVTENDLINGFTVKVDVYVKENRGRYAGNQAHVVYEFVYTPAN